MDDSLIISHVENECAPTISLLQSGTFYVVINDRVICARHLPDLSTYVQSYTVIKNIQFK